MFGKGKSLAEFVRTAYSTLSYSKDMQLLLVFLPLWDDWGVYGSRSLESAKALLWKLFNNWWL